MTFDFIIAHHNENNYRERNLNEIIKYYLDIIPSDTNIIIVEQETETTLPEDPRIIHIKEKYDTKYFWKAKLLNRGVAACDKEAFCVVDSDAIISKEAIDHLSTLNSDFNMMFPYNKVKMLNEGETRIWIKNRKIPKTIDESYQKYPMCYTGFFMVMSKSNYDLVGGFDEEYIGWGGEDDAMVIKTNRLSNITEMPFESLVMHMYHPRKDNTEYLASDRFKTNEIYTYAMKVMPKAILESYCKGETTLEQFVKDREITSESRIKRIWLKNKNFTDIAVTGVYPLPDDENGTYSMETLFKGLYVLLGEEQFVHNIDRLIDASSDEEEKDSIRSLVQKTIKSFP
jgi:predicted glycosyltransferase involved in capsule biosynthesis